MQNQAELIAQVRATIGNRLPRSRRWHLYGSTLDFEFDQSRMRRFSANDMVGAPDPLWLELIIFGKTDFAEGGGAGTYMTIEPVSGRIFDLDVEVKEPLSLLNASLEQYIQTFIAIDPFLSANEPVPQGVIDAVARIDLESFAQSKYWQGIIDGAGKTE